jgi:peptidoglycan-N-acetylglucosamine deacetylase
MFLIQPNKFIKWIYNDAIWRVKTEEKKIYLTFDDGPIPKITPWVIDILKSFNIKATFFCVGENISKNPDIYKAIVAEKHSIGNHCYNHLNGWETNNSTYFNNVEECNKLINSNLYRPPYGRMKQSQYAHLKNKYNIIMWDVLSGDYRVDITPEACLKRTIENTREGSIVVFHENEKSKQNMCYTLPRYIEYYLKQGWIFDALE